MKHSPVILLLVGILFGCDSEVGTPIDQGVADPFLVGNYWVYNLHNLDSNAMSEDSVIVTKSEANGNGKTITLSNGRSYFKDSIGIWTDCILLYNFFPTAGDTLFGGREVMIKIDGEVGPGTIITTVETINILVSVQAGVFITNKYHLFIVKADGTIVADLITYFSPSIGIIKEEYWEASSNWQPPLHLKYSRELLRYKVR